MEKRSSVTTRLISSRSDAASCLGLGLVGDRLDLVDDVAERDDLLGHAVVHLAGDPVALLGGGHQADVVEEDRGVEAQDELVGDGLGLVAQVVGPPGVADQDDGAEPLLPAVQPHGLDARVGPGRGLGGGRDDVAAVRREQVGLGPPPVDEDGGAVGAGGGAQGGLQLRRELDAVETDGAPAGQGVELGHQLVGRGVRRLPRLEVPHRPRLPAGEQPDPHADDQPRGGLE